MIQEVDFGEKLNVHLISYKGSENIGLFGHFAEKLCILPPDFNIPTSEKVVRTRALNTEFLGIFFAGNLNCTLIPEHMEKAEIEPLIKGKVNFEIIKAKTNALGNLILCNDYGCLISKELKDFKKEISKALDVKTEIGRIAGLDFPGSCAVATNKWALLHRDCAMRELERIESLLEVKADIGSINFGSPYIGSGMLANSKEVFVGNKTTPYELGKVLEVIKNGSGA